MLNGEPITSFYWMILCTRYVLRLIHAHLFISFLVCVFFIFHSRRSTTQLLLLLRELFFYVCSADYNPVFLRYSFSTLQYRLHSTKSTQYNLFHLIVSKFSVVFSFSLSLYSSFQFFVRLFVSGTVAVPTESINYSVEPKYSQLITANCR